MCAWISMCLAIIALAQLLRTLWLGTYRSRRLILHEILRNSSGLCARWRGMPGVW
jgi:hypothetical protein